ncbi:MAG TPA: hypothetical protein VFA45_11200 [Actinomycetes bacterium]|jgi:hypothetical protein|nr:hypothetical protein [Actinomycetes bacterium]
MSFLRNTSDPDDPYLYCTSCGEAAGSADDRRVRLDLEQHSWGCAGPGQCDDRSGARR